MVLNVVAIMANTIVLNVADQQDERLGQFPRKAIFGCLSNILCIKFKTAVKESETKITPKEVDDRATSGNDELGKEVTRSEMCMSNDDPQPETDEQTLWQNERTTAVDILDRWFFIVFSFMIIFCTLLTVTCYEWDTQRHSTVLTMRTTKCISLILIPQWNCRIGTTSFVKI